MPRTYFCQRAESPITIDGQIGKQVWLQAPWTEDFVDIEGESKPPPKFRTRAKMLWSDEFFYIAAELEEPHIWGTITDQNFAVFEDNDFEIFVDPDGDCHNYVEIEINALGTVWDLFLPKPYRAGGIPLTGWNIDGLQSAVSVNGSLNDPSDIDRNWCVELAIPWRAFRDETRLRKPPSVGEVWSVNFSRVQWETETHDNRYEKVKGRDESNWVWSPQGVIDMHRPAMWGEVVFCDANFDGHRKDNHKVKQVLSRIFDLQIEHFSANAEFASGEYILKCLGLDLNLRIEATSRQFTAFLQNQEETWIIDHESRMVLITRNST